jgi:hypothetical protein
MARVVHGRAAFKRDVRPRSRIPVKWTRSNHPSFKADRLTQLQGRTEVDVCQALNIGKADTGGHRDDHS